MRLQVVKYKPIDKRIAALVPEVDARYGRTSMLHTLQDADRLMS